MESIARAPVASPATAPGLKPGPFYRLLNDSRMPQTFVDSPGGILLGLAKLMHKRKSDLLQGTLSLLILKLLALKPMHGCGITQQIQLVSDYTLCVNYGSLYPALYRLEHQGWIEAKWGSSDNNRHAKYYSLTPAGRKQLLQQAENWEKLSAAINRVLETPEIGLHQASQPDSYATRSTEEEPESGSGQGDVRSSRSGNGTKQ